VDAELGDPRAGRPHLLVEAWWRRDADGMLAPVAGGR
jgi:hypothetical protein